MTKKFFCSAIFGITALCAVSSASLYACSNQQIDPNYSIKNGSQSLHGELGIAGKDSKKWNLFYQDQIKEAALQLRPVEQHSDFDDSIIFIDENGYVNWTTKAIETTYYFKVVYISQNVVISSSPIIQLKITDKKKFVLNGGSTYLYGEQSFAGGDTKQWYTTFDGKIVTDVNLSIEKESSIDFDLSLVDNKVCWQDDATEGTHLFRIKAQYVDPATGIAYTTQTQQISLFVVSKRSVNIFGGSKTIYTERNLAGKTKQQWQVSLPGTNQISTFWELVSIDTNPIPSWLSIDNDGYIHWTEDVTNYEFKIKVQVIDNEKQYRYESITNDTIKIEITEAKKLVINYNPDQTKIKPINKIADYYSDNKSPLTISLLSESSNQEIPIDSENLEIKCVDHSSHLEMTQFSIQPTSLKKTGLLSWNDDLLPGVRYKFIIAAKYIDPASGNEYVGYSDVPIDLYVYYNFEFDGWDTIIEASKEKDSNKRLQILEKRYSYTDYIGRVKNLDLAESTWSSTTHKVRLIDMDHDFLNFEGTEKAAFTFEFANVISDSRGAANTYQINSQDSLKQNHNSWHFDNDDEVYESELCANLNDGEKGKFIPGLPENLRNNLKTVYKECYKGHAYLAVDSEKIKPNNCWIKDKIFLPSIEELGYEVSINDIADQAIEGTIYQYYANAKKTQSSEQAWVKKDVSGRPMPYWFRTPFYIHVPDPTRVPADSGFADNVICYTPTHISTFKLATSSLPIAPCFCL